MSPVNFENVPDINYFTFGSFVDLNFNKFKGGIFYSGQV